MPASTHPIRRRAARAAFVISTLTILAAACGDDDVESPAATASADTAATTQPSPATTAAVSGYVHASGAEDVVIEIGFEGGFVPVEIAFTRVPNLLVTGDGRAIETGPVIAIFPGPLLPNLQQRSISEAAVQTLLARADELGLLADIQYARNDLIADAPDTVVRISVERATYEHRAYALGLGEGGETDAARVNLAEFAAAAADLAGTVGEAELGPQAPFDGEEYLVRATPVGPGETAGGDVAPTIVEWPPASSVRLADASDCAVVLPGEGDALFVNATQLTFFADAGVTFRVAAIGRLPGRGC